MTQKSKNNSLKTPPPSEGVGGRPYIFSIADNALILAQRLSELCGHGPTLETDMALTNISLDLFGQTRGYFQYAAKLSSDKKTEDDLAFLRNEREYRNVLLVEQPNRNFAHTIARQFFYDHFHILLMEELQESKDETLSAIAKKGVKEVRYHQRFSSDWVKRLGDGTEESHQKMQEAINDLWRYTDELFHLTNDDKVAIKKGIGVDVSKFREIYYKNISEILKKATLEIPEQKYFQKGGKNGVHTEHMGYILADMQYMQKTFPRMEW